MRGAILVLLLAAACARGGPASAPAPEARVTAASDTLDAHRVLRDGACLERSRIGVAGDGHGAEPSGPSPRVSREAPAPSEQLDRPPETSRGAEPLASIDAAHATERLAADREPAGRLELWRGGSLVGPRAPPV